MRSINSGLYCESNDSASVPASNVSSARINRTSPFSNNSSYVDPATAESRLEAFAGLWNSLNYIGKYKENPSPHRSITRQNNYSDTIFNAAINLRTTIMHDRTLLFYIGFLMLLILMALFQDSLSLYAYSEFHFDQTNELKRLNPPSLEHPMGTTDNGQDVYSRFVLGARETLVTGLLGGAIIITIGSLIGVSAGYFGGIVDSVLMRFTDFMYGVPLIPVAIVLLSLFNVDYWGSILIIGLVLWRDSARALRSQVFQIRERPFVQSAKAKGASDIRIIRKYIVPNIGSLIVLLFSLSVGYAIIVQASLAFIGVVNPFVPSWGVMLRNVYDSGYVISAWWWSIPPGLFISFTVYCSFMLGRKYTRESPSQFVGRSNR